MALMKFLTVYDDEYGHILNLKKQKMLDVSAYPSMFFAEGKPYYDSINTNSQSYINMVENSFDVTEPTVPANIFEPEFVRAYKNGYLGVFVVCPHSKWTDYRHQAEIAKKRFYRKVNIDELGFKINIINSKTFAAGTLLYTFNIADLYSSFHYSTDEFCEIVQHNTSNVYTYVLAEGKTAFGENSSLNAYMIKNNKLIPLEISQYSDSVIFDKFANIVCDGIRLLNREYSVSLGYECNFAANVLGRIEKLSGRNPCCAIQYGVPTASILGSKAFCVSIV